jgi:hypothetical protein
MVPGGDANWSSMAVIALRFHEVFVSDRDSKSAPVYWNSEYFDADPTEMPAIPYVVPQAGGPTHPPPTWLSGIPPPLPVVPIPSTGG